MTEITAENATAPARKRKRRWWVAVFLSLGAPGLGHIYAGKPNRGFALTGAFVAVFLLMLTFSGDASAGWLFIEFLAVVASLLALQLFSLIDAGLIARRAREIQLGRTNKIWIYLCVICFWAGFAELIKPTTPFKTYSIPSASMHPTLQIGDYVLASKDWYRRNSPERGEVATLLWPKDNQTFYVKRIVGLPGDKVQMIGDHLWINGAMVDEQRVKDADLTNVPARQKASQFIETIGDNHPHQIIKALEPGILANTELFEVPDDMVFTLGDNRDNSSDSRVPVAKGGIGLVPVGNLLDRPGYIIWSRDWGRIGQVVE